MLDKENKRRTVVLLLMVLSVLNVFAQLSSRGKDTPTSTTDRLSSGLEYKLIFNDEFNQPDGALPDIQYKKEPDNPEQWPFDKSDFYLILNQSVGDGSWAKPVDTTHTYQMEIDWIRVYQRDKTNINKRK